MIWKEYTTPGPPLTRWQNFKGTVIVAAILVGFTLVMWPYALGVAARRYLAIG